MSNKYRYWNLFLHVQQPPLSIFYLPIYSWIILNHTIYLRREGRVVYISQNCRKPFLLPYRMVKAHTVYFLERRNCRGWDYKFMTTHDERTRRFIPLSCILTLASTHKPFDKFEDLLPQNDHQNYKYTLKTSKRVELQNICLQHLFSII